MNIHDKILLYSRFVFRISYSKLAITTYILFIIILLEASSLLGHDNGFVVLINIIIFTLLFLYYLLENSSNDVFKNILIEEEHKIHTKNIQLIRDNDGTTIYVLYKKEIYRCPKDLRVNEDLHIGSKISLYMNKSIKERKSLKDFEGTMAEIRSKKINKLIHI